MVWRLFGFGVTHFRIVVIMMCCVTTPLLPREIILQTDLMWCPEFVSTYPCWA